MSTNEGASEGASVPKIMMESERGPGDLIQMGLKLGLIGGGGGITIHPPGSDIRI